MTSNGPAWRDAVLAFWFDELSREDWFSVSEILDREIIERFSQTYNSLAGQGAHQRHMSGRDALAAIIVLDQFPRNMFRASPKAFATDAAALAISQDAVEQRLDTGLNIHERQFLYMPHMHCEDAGIQKICVELFKGLGDESSTNFAIRHKQIIDRFGRFPHRNEVLGRKSTAEEITFLTEPNSSF